MPDCVPFLIASSSWASVLDCCQVGSVKFGVCRAATPRPSALWQPAHFFTNTSLASPHWGIGELGAADAAATGFGGGILFGAAPGTTVTCASAALGPRSA